jgi:hypothetical protein
MLAAAFLLVGLWAGSLMGCGPEQRTCQVNDDCKFKGEACEAGICVQEKACETDADCKLKGEVCQEKRCVFKGGNLTPKCPSSCSSDKDCKDCQGGRQTCIRSMCAQKEPAKAYERCGEDRGKACVDKTLCAGATKNTYCLPLCDAKQPSCDGGKGICRDPVGNGQGICLPLGNAESGKPCSSNFTGDPTLDRDKLCKKGLHCVNDVCKKPVVVGDYKACGAGTVCSDKAACVILSTLAAASYCLPFCQTPGSDCNNGKGTCVKTAQGQGVCLLKGTSDKDTPCGPDGDDLKAEHFCTKDLRCVSVSMRGSICLPAVQKCSASACGAGRTCLTENNGGYCALSCDANGSCPGKLSCQPVKIGTQEVKVCGP